MVTGILFNFLATTQPNRLFTLLTYPPKHVLHDIPKCGGVSVKVHTSKAKPVGNNQKIFTFCPNTNKSTIPGFEEGYDNYEHFKESGEDEELMWRESTATQN